MDVILTSFGAGMQSLASICSEPDTRFSLFYRMPPLMLEERGTFRLDYAGLFMFDRVIVDEKTYQQAIDPKLEEYEEEGLTKDAIKMLRQSVAEYSKFFQALESSGHLVTKDFDGIFSQAEEVWEQATDYDMGNITEWAKPLELSLEKWSKVEQHVIDGIEKFWGHPERAMELLFVPYRPHALSTYDHADNILDTLKNWKRQQSEESRDYTREIVRDYLSYVNFNLILSFECEAAFLDWEDMQPFYDKKFTLAGRRKYPEAQKIQQSRKLFELLFPHFAPKNPKSLVRAIEDKRIEELRLLIQQSLEGSVEFDSNFAIRTLKEVLKLEHKAILRRRICGWATMPLGFIPVVGSGVEKAGQELLNVLWANRPLHKYRWFYLINELDESSS